MDRFKVLYDFFLEFQEFSLVLLSECALTINQGVFMLG